MSLVIIGDSHTHALRKGAAALPPKEISAAGMPVSIGAFGNGRHTIATDFSSIKDGSVVFTIDEYSEAMEHLLGRNDLSGDTFGIVLGYHSLPVVRHKTWSKFAPYQIAAKHARSGVSEQIIAEMIAVNNQFIYRFFDRLIESAARFFIISAPPVRRDHPCFRTTPEEIGLAVDQSFRAAMDRFAADRKIPVVKPPHDIYDHSGFLREDYADISPSDHHHANTAYGAKMLREILSRVHVLDKLS